MNPLTFGKPLPAALAQADKLPSLPTVALEVLRLTQEDDTTLDDMAEVISRDPALSAKILRFANSSIFNLNHEVTTLQRATLVLGMKSVQLMSLSFSLAGSLTQDGCEDGFDCKEFWRRSLATAVAGRAFSALVGNTIEDEAFLCGLLSRIGQMVMFRCLDEYAEVLARSGDGLPSARLEEEMLGFDHADVGAALLESWSLPPVIYMGVGYMHRPDDLEDVPERIRSIAAAMHAATLSVEVLCGEQSGEALGRLESEALERFELTSEEVSSHLLSLETAFRETSEVLEMPMPTGRAHQEILEEAREQLFLVGISTAEDLRSLRSESADLSHRRHIPEDPRYLDGKTGLVNRAGFDELLGAEIRVRLEHHIPRPVGVLLIEIDRFGGLRDTFGEETATEIMRLVAVVLRRMTRRGDVSTSFEQGRFGIFLPECTPFGLKALSERVREAVRGESVAIDGEKVSATVSIGGACLGKVGSIEDGEGLMGICLRYLKSAGKKGPDRAELHATVLEPRPRA